MRSCSTTAPAFGLAALLLGGPALAEQAAARPPGGFHAGVFAGGVRIESSVAVPAMGPRPAKTVDDQGATGFLFGAVAGYGRLFPSGLYLGAELEFAVPQDVVSRVRIHGREMRARLTTDGGVFVRAGASWDGQGLAFLRAGVTVPRQAFETAGGREVSNRWLATPAVGAGFELPLSRTVALRGDVTYAFPAGENPVDSLRATLGLTHRF